MATYDTKSRRSFNDRKGSYGLWDQKNMNKGMLDNSPYHDFAKK